MKVFALFKFGVDFMHRIENTSNVNDQCNVRCKGALHYDLVYVTKTTWEERYNGNDYEERFKKTAILDVKCISNQSIEIRAIDFPRETMSAIQYYPCCALINGNDSWENSIPVGVYYTIL